MKLIARQGDVGVVEVQIPEGAKKLEAQNGLYAVAYGEVSGHAHCIEASEDVEMYEKDGVLYLKASKPVELKHLVLATQTKTQDHDSGTIPAGTHKFVIQKEVQPDGIVRPVID